MDKQFLVDYDPEYIAAWQALLLDTAIATGGDDWGEVVSILRELRKEIQSRLNEKYVKYQFSVLVKTDWHSVRNDLRKEKAKLDRQIKVCKESIKNSDPDVQSIFQGLLTELNQRRNIIESDIAHVADNIKIVNRHKTVIDMSTAGCSRGDIRVNTRLPKGVKRPMLNKDGSKHNK